ncbi:MAG: glycosyltransferase [Bacteroidales bacterium]|nr:glycosyltransferase [Bacteroidales bacterium]
MQACHLTSVHNRFDTRIFVNEIPSLASEGFEVCAIVADGKGDEERKNFNIYDVGKPKTRFHRILFTTKRVYKKALEVDAKAYHLHDPELLLIAKKLKKRGKKVIYDAHEDVPRQIVNKHWINKGLRKVISNPIEFYENRISKKLDYIITATSFIRDRFLLINKNVTDINNFPIIASTGKTIDEAKRKKEICYIGSISKVRGLNELVEALSLLPGVSLNLAGTYSPENYKNDLKKIPGWEKVIEYGFANREMAKEIMNRSIAGMVTLHPIINYIDALPVKMFEYMAAGIPVIASDFPLWKNIVEGCKCGICVDPLNPEVIAKAVQYIFQHKKEASQMGLNGRKAVLEKYNWEIEKQKLIGVYKKLI